MELRCRHECTTLGCLDTTVPVIVVPHNDKMGNTRRRYMANTKKGTVTVKRTVPSAKRVRVIGLASLASLARSLSLCCLVQYKKGDRESQGSLVSSYCRSFSSGSIRGNDRRRLRARRRPPHLQDPGSRPDRRSEHLPQSGSRLHRIINTYWVNSAEGACDRI